MPPPSPPPAYKFASKDSLRQAVQAFDENPASAEATYGRIASWDVSGISDMSELFKDFTTFNEDVSNWDTSRVTNMNYMFRVRCRPPPGTTSRALFF